MESQFESAITFGSLLRENAKASQFYNACTPEQKQAILHQLHNVRDLRAFVDNLPSAAL